MSPLPQSSAKPGALVASTTLAVTAAGTPARMAMGITIAAYGLRWKSNVGSPEYPAFRDPLDFLAHCEALGGAGIQTGVSGWDKALAQRLRTRCETSNLFLEGQIGLPNGPADQARFESELRTAHEAGATIFRTVMLGGRRYETFKDAAAFATFRQKSWESLVLAEASAKKVGVRLAVENHKDWRVGELLDLIQRISSEHVGICIDTGNSIALLEDPMEVVTAYAPWAVTSHFKDMAVRDYEDGFLLAEVAFGDGFLDLARILEIVRSKNKQVRINLETITRDPLKVPCLKDSYWITLGDTPAHILARTFASVRRHTGDRPLPQISGLTPEKKLQAEEEMVRNSFAYARSKLGL